ncbi:type IV pilus modification protein PilV [Hydrogenophilus thermoluteolus]|uniref:type IV pilus modification protein PilV n=1 Tax=Hydrogenophilus thermoluteolus TaxID=297 RepID=UPI003F67066A
MSQIEILIAVLVLAVGLLGVAALQANALKTNQSAVARSQAAMLAYLILDAMRANRDAATSGGVQPGKPGAGQSGLHRTHCEQSGNQRPSLLVGQTQRKPG